MNNPLHTRQKLAASWRKICERKFVAIKLSILQTDLRTGYGTKQIPEQDHNHCNPEE